MGATVMDINGTPLGVVSKEGKMPNVNHDPVTIHCLGFEDFVVGEPTDQVVMKEKSYELKEFSIKP